MKKNILLLIILFIINCSSGPSENGEEGDLSSYGNFSEKTSRSRSGIDRFLTYEVFFTTKKEVKCLTISVQSVEIKKSFPVGRVPVETYFHIDKIIEDPASKGSQAILLGKNYNREWKTFNPMKACTKSGDPLSRLGPGKYRIRFTTFSKKSFFYRINIRTDEKVIFTKMENDTEK